MKIIARRSGAVNTSFEDLVEVVEGGGKRAGIGIGLVGGDVVGSWSIYVLQLIEPSVHVGEWEFVSAGNSANLANGCEAIGSKFLELESCKVITWGDVEIWYACEVDVASVANSDKVSVESVGCVGSNFLNCDETIWIACVFVTAPIWK